MEKKRPVRLVYWVHVDNTHMRTKIRFSAGQHYHHGGRLMCFAGSQKKKGDVNKAMWGASENKL